MEKRGNQEVLVKHLIENNVSLQKASLNLMDSMNTLTKRIDKLVSIFEEASKHITDVELSDERLKNLASKLEGLLDQNKEIARGLILLEQYIRSKSDVKQFSERPVAEFKL
ncbi:hypothetical protein J4455_02280 [Candidatus Woesearchaeota archaeon]|nr:hypothetical protein [Candidatus Woesearchaeota archaeon]